MFGFIMTGVVTSGFVAGIIALAQWILGVKHLSLGFFLTYSLVVGLGASIAYWLRVGQIVGAQEEAFAALTEASDRLDGLVSQLWKVRTEIMHATALDTALQPLTANVVGALSKELNSRVPEIVKRLVDESLRRLEVSYSRLNGVVHEVEEVTQASLDAYPLLREICQLPTDKERGRALVLWYEAMNGGDWKKVRAVLRNRQPSEGSKEA